MTTTTKLELLAPSSRGAVAASTNATKSIVRSRVAMSAVLTAITVVLGAVIGVGLGPVALGLYLFSLLLPLGLLWLSSDVVRADERARS